MPRPDFPANILEFQQRFNTEDACLDYLVASRWPDGFVCPRCKGTQAYNMTKAKHLFECKACRYQASVTAGTVMHKTGQPLVLWFWAAYFVTTVTPGMSAVQFQRQLGIGRYETAFQMLHKLRAAMVRPDRDRIGGRWPVEVEETYVGGKTRGEGRGVRHP